MLRIQVQSPSTPTFPHHLAGLKSPRLVVNPASVASPRLTSAHSPNSPMFKLSPITTASPRLALPESPFLSIPEEGSGVSSPSSPRSPRSPRGSPRHGRGARERRRRGAIDPTVAVLPSWHLFSAAGLRASTFADRMARVRTGKLTLARFRAPEALPAPHVLVRVANGLSQSGRGEIFRFLQPHGHADGPACPLANLPGLGPASTTAEIKLAASSLQGVRVIDLEDTNDTPLGAGVYRQLSFLRPHTVRQLSVGPRMLDYVPGRAVTFHTLSREGLFTRQWNIDTAPDCPTRIVHVSYDPEIAAVNAAALLPALASTGKFDEVVIILTPTSRAKRTSPVQWGRDPPATGFLFGVVRHICAALYPPRYTLVGIDDVPAQLLGLDAAATTEDKQRHLRHSVASRLADLGPEHARRILKDVSFCSHDEYRERVGDQQYALETDPNAVAL